MTFLARLMAAQWHRRCRYALALREHQGLMLFDLDDLLATGLMHVGRGGGIAVMRIHGHFVRFELRVLSQVAHHRNFTGFTAFHWGVGQEGPGGMTHREDHGLLVPGGECASQYLAIYGDPVVRRTQLHLHATMLVDQRVQLHPVHARQESWYVGTRYHTGLGVLCDLAQPRNAVTERAKDARDFRASTENRSDHPRQHKRSRMTFASIISIIGSLPERLDNIADMCFHIHYIDAHGLSPFETQYGLVTLIILRFPKDVL